MSLSWPKYKSLFIASALGIIALASFEFFIWETNDGPCCDDDINYLEIAGPKYSFGRQCPVIHQDDGRFVILPRTYPIKEIYAGLVSDEDYRDFLKTLIEISKVKGIELNILVPQDDMDEVFYNFEKNFSKKKYPNLEFISLPSHESLWARDYMKFAYDTKNFKSMIVDLPYIGRDGEDIPTNLAHIKKMSLIDYPKESSEKMKASDSDYGGNIMPLTENLIAVGANMSEETKNYLKKNISQQIIELDVGWLETGHVDEIISVIPNPNGNNHCDFGLSYASPALALRLLKEDHQQHDVGELGGVIYLNAEFDEEQGEQERTDYTDCFSLIQGGQHNETLLPSFCQEYLKANRFYEKIIFESVKSVTEKIKQTDGCENISVTPFPVLFSPARPSQKYGLESDNAMASNPNLINNIYIDGLLLIPEQSYTPFHNYMENYLDEIKQKHLFIRGRVLHLLSGGLHCATNKNRYCLPIN